MSIQKDGRGNVPLNSDENKARFSKLVNEEEILKNEEKKIFVKALYEFSSQKANTITMKAGDYVQLQQQELIPIDGWFLVSRHSHQGYVPANYVEPVAPLNIQPWFVGLMSRSESELICQHENALIVRISDKYPGYILSDRSEKGDKVTHSKIDQSDELGFRFANQDWKICLPELVDSYIKKKESINNFIQSADIKADIPSSHLNQSNNISLSSEVVTSTSVKTPIPSLMDEEISWSKNIYITSNVSHQPTGSKDEVYPKIRHNIESNEISWKTTMEEQAKMQKHLNNQLEEIETIIQKNNNYLSENLATDELELNANNQNAEESRLISSNTEEFNLLIYGDNKKENTDILLDYISSIDQTSPNEDEKLNSQNPEASAPLIEASAPDLKLDFEDSFDPQSMNPVIFNMIDEEAKTLKELNEKYIHSTPQRVYGDIPEEENIKTKNTFEDTTKSFDTKPEEPPLINIFEDKDVDNAVDEAITDLDSQENCFDYIRFFDEYIPDEKIVPFSKPNETDIKIANVTMPSELNLQSPDNSKNSTDKKQASPEVKTHRRTPPISGNINPPTFSITSPLISVPSIYIDPIIKDKENFETHDKFHSESSEMSKISQVNESAQSGDQNPNGHPSATFITGDLRDNKLNIPLNGNSKPRINFLEALKNKKDKKEMTGKDGRPSNLGFSAEAPENDDTSPSSSKDKSSTLKDGKKAIVKTLGKKLSKSNKAVKGAYSNLKSKAGRKNDNVNGQSRADKD